jgi:hypothetical protein
MGKRYDIGHNLPRDARFIAAIILANLGGQVVGLSPAACTRPFPLSPGFLPPFLTVPEYAFPDLGGIGASYTGTVVIKGTDPWQGQASVGLPRE